MNYIVDKTFERAKFNELALEQGEFENCVFRHCDFSNINLSEIKFTECDLTGSVFQNSDLAGAIFENTILEKADLRTLLNYSIDPENNRIRETKFSILEISGLLNKYDIEIDSNI